MKQAQRLAAGCRAVGTSCVRVSRVTGKAVGKSAAELGLLHLQLASMPVSPRPAHTRCSIV